MIRRNTAGQPVLLGPLESIADGSPVTTGATIQTRLGGTTASGAGTLTHVAGGVWEYTPVQAETDSNVVGLILSATSARPVAMTVLTTTIPTQDTDGVIPVDVRQIAGQTANAAAAVTFPGTVSTLDAAGVWAHSTRSLTTFGTLVSDLAAAVWTAGARTLTAFGFTVDTNPVALSNASGNALVSAVAAQITTDHGNGDYRRNTEPDNTGIAATLAAVGALSIPTAANNAAAVWAATDRTLSAFAFEVTLKSGQKIGLTDGSISEATFVVLADAPGVPTGPIGWLRRLFLRSYGDRDRDRGSGVVRIKAANGTVLCTETQSTVGNIDSVTRAV